MLTSPPELFQRAQVLKDAGSAFVIATVVRVRGSASAKTGSKALFDDKGINLYGYIGGGCAEAHVAQEACEALKEKQPRIVEIDLDDEVYGLMPCGGVMDVYIEPHFSAPTLPVPHLGPWNPAAAQLLRELGFQSETAKGPLLPVQNWRELILLLGNLLADFKGYPFEPLRNTKGFGAAPLPSLSLKAPPILVFGQTRITEEFCRILQLLEWSSTICLPEQEDFPARSWVIIASHHRQDAAIAERALRAGADYVALVASEKRSGLIVDDMLERGLAQERLDHFFAPAGLNVPTETPLQIAFSILCEILRCQDTDV